MLNRTFVAMLCVMTVVFLVPLAFNCLTYAMMQGVNPPAAAAAALPATPSTPQNQPAQPVPGCQPAAAAPFSEQEASVLEGMPLLPSHVWAPSSTIAQHMTSRTMMVLQSSCSSVIPPRPVAPVKGPDS